MFPQTLSPRNISDRALGSCFVFKFKLNIIPKLGDVFPFCSCQDVLTEGASRDAGAPRLLQPASALVS